MADPLYARALASATRILAKYGEPSIVERRTFDETADAGFYTPVSATTFDVFIFWTNEGKTASQFMGRTVDDLPDGGCYGIFAAGSYTPVMADTVTRTFDGSRWNISKVDCLAPGGVAILWFIEATRT